MNKSSLLKNSFLLLVYLLFSGSRTDIYGQTDFYLDAQIYFDYKWSVTQKWNDLTGDWNDTLKVSYTIPGANGKPSEIITRRYDDLSGDLREVITYDGDKIANTVGYIKDSLSGEYQKKPSYTSTRWYSGDILVKIENTFQISEDSDVKLHSETRFSYQNQRKNADSTFTKFSGTIEDLTQQGIAPEDTVWLFNNRSEYSYKENSIVTLQYDNEGSPNGKDSTVFIGDKISEIYEFGFKNDGELVVMGLTKITYDGDLITQIIYQERENESLVNRERTQFFHTPYPLAGTKHISSSHKTNRISAFVSESNGFYTVNLSLNQLSDVSICLTDLKGRKLGNNVNRRVMPGSSSLPLPVLSPGKYLCHIISGQERTVVPFTKIK